MNGREINRDMTGIMKIFSSFISKPKNVYGFSFYKTTIRDTRWFLARFTSPRLSYHCPVYAYFDILKSDY